MLPAGVPPTTSTLRPPTAAASRNRAACRVTLPKTTSSSSEFACSTNVRMLTRHPAGDVRGVMVAPWWLADRSDQLMMGRAEVPAPSQARGRTRSAVTGRWSDPDVLSTAALHVVTLLCKT